MSKASEEKPSLKLKRVAVLTNALIEELKDMDNIRSPDLVHKNIVYSIRVLRPLEDVDASICNICGKQSFGSFGAHPDCKWNNKWEGRNE